MLKLQQGPSNTLTSRRSSNDSVIRTTNRQSSVLSPLKGKGVSILSDLLQSSLDWSFDIFKLEQISEKHPLVYLGMELFRRFELFEAFNVDEQTCRAWLTLVEVNYHSSNTYHNSTHAADVMQVRIHSNLPPVLADNCRTMVFLVFYSVGCVGGGHRRQQYFCVVFNKKIAS